MERTLAIKKLRKLLGKELGYRVDPGAPKQEERDAAQVALKPAVAERDAVGKQLEERRLAILAADSGYQRLKAARKDAGAHVDQLFGIVNRYKITVGTTPGRLFFHVKAQGDSWEQVIAKLTEGRRA